MKTPIAFTVLFFLFFIGVSIAQRDCGTMDYYHQQLIDDPAFAGRRQQIANHTAAYVAAHQNNLPHTNAVITIPVVFHVVYNNAAQNISAVQCQAQVDQLNLDYARLNTDASNTPSAFAAVAANIGVQFCLAVRDPNGNTTTGIERRQTTVTSFSTNNNVKYYSTGGMDAWPSESYLNIWTCYFSGTLLGYAQFPGGNAATDGIAIMFSTVGSMLQPSSAASYNIGRTATHEVGHWLDLYHIWGDDGSACTGTDYVADTPNQGANTWGCPAFPHTDACSTSSPGIMFMNYMDYSDDYCVNMFTEGQSARMNAVLAPGGDRETLLSSLGCQPVILPPCTGVTAGVVSASNDTLCSGENAILTLSGTTSGVSGISLLWETSPNGISGWNAASGLNTNFTYTTPVAAGINYYRCAATCTPASMTNYSDTMTIWEFGIGSVANDHVCVAGLTDIIASGFGQINWFTDSLTSTVLHVGDTLSANLLGDTVFYAVANASAGVGNYYSVGPVNNTFGGGGNSTNLSRGLVFQALTGLMLDSVSFYPSSTGNVVINLVDVATSGTVNTATFPVTSGQVNQKVKVYLGFTAIGGHTYNLTAAGSSVTSLYRNNSNVTFPYSVSNIISITQSTSSTTSYYFFYDWKLHTGCTSPRVAVPVHVGPLNVTITSTADTICTGSGVTLTTSGANSYLWMPGSLPGNTITVYPLSTTVYSVTGFVSVGCTGTDLDTVTLVAPPTVTISVSNDTICRGTSTTLTASGASTYTWYPLGTSGSSITVSPANNTNYSVIGSVGSCTGNSSQFVTVLAPSFTAAAVGSNSICKGDTAVLSVTGTNTYIWMPGGLTGNTVSVAPLTTKTYTVTGTDLMGCTATQTVIIYVNNCLSVDEINSEDVFLIYPNPTDNLVTLELRGLKSVDYEFEMYDALGQLVFNKKIRPEYSGFLMNMDLKYFSQGVYFIRLRGNGEQVVRKLMKL